MAEGRSIGTIFAELDLDASRYLRGQQQLLRDATSTTLNIEQNFKNLGVKSSAEMDLMRAKIINSFDMIKHSSQATANDILRAEKAKNDQLAKLDEQQFGHQATLLETLKANWLAFSAAAVAGWYTISRAAGVATDALETYRKLAEEVRSLSYLSGGTPQQVSALVDVMGDLGVETAAVEAGLNKMSAAIESGSPALERLGIGIRDNSGHLKTGLTLFYETIDALGKTRSEVERNSLAREIFGRGWIQMVPVIEQGSAALKAMAAESNKVLSPEDLQRARQYQLAISNLKDSLEAIKIEFSRGIVIPITIALQGASGWLDRLLSQHKNAGKAAAEAGRAGQREYFGMDLDIGETTAAQAAQWATWKPTTGSEPETAGEKAARDKREKIAAEALEKYIKGEVAAAEEVIRLNELENKYINEGLTEQVKANEDARKKIMDGQVAQAEEAIRLNELETKNALELQAAEVKARADANKAILESELAAAVEQDRLNQEEAKADQDRLAALVEARTKAMEPFREVFTSIADGITTAVRGVQQGTQTMEDMFKNMAVNIMLSIQDMVIRRGIEAISNALVGAKGSSDTGLIGAALAGLGSWLGGSTGGTAWGAGGGLTFAGGGMVPGPIGAPMLAMVHGGERVLTPEQQGGGGITQVFAPNVGIPEAIRRELWAMMPQIRRETTAAVLEARGRGGAMARAMGARR